MSPALASRFLTAGPPEKSINHTVRLIAKASRQRKTLESGMTFQSLEINSTSQGQRTGVSLSKVNSSLLIYAWEILLIFSQEAEICPFSS